MRVPGHRTIARTARGIRSRLVDHGIILGYHRIKARDDDPFDLCVSPDNFAEQLEVLRSAARIMPLVDLASAVADGRVPADSVALSFDDGYRDYLTSAIPLMNAAGVASTIFIASGVTGEEFWWDRLARLLARAPAGQMLPADILDPSGRADSAKIPRGENRKDLTNEAYLRLLRLQPSERNACLQQLECWCDVSDVSAAQNDLDDRVMDPSEISDLASNELVEIGAHTISHPMLAWLAAERQQAEVEGSKAALEAMTGAPVHAFSYPNGSKTAETIKLVGRCGFRYACASQVDVVWHRSNLFDLPRIWVPDYDGDAFRKWLARWIKLRG